MGSDTPRDAGDTTLPPVVPAADGEGATRPSTGTLPLQPSRPQSGAASTRPRSSRSSGGEMKKQLQFPQQLVYTKEEYATPPLYNPLLANEVYRKAGSNSIFEIRPSILHFGGYKVGKIMKQTFRIINISQSSQRLHLLDPGTRFFTVNYKKKVHARNRNTAILRLPTQH